MKLTKDEMRTLSYCLTRVAREMGSLNKRLMDDRLPMEVYGPAGKLANDLRDLRDRIDADANLWDDASTAINATMVEQLREWANAVARADIEGVAAGMRDVANDIERKIESAAGGIPKIVDQVPDGLAADGPKIAFETTDAAGEMMECGALTGIDLIQAIAMHIDSMMDGDFPAGAIFFHLDGYGETAYERWCRSAEAVAYGVRGVYPQGQASEKKGDS